MKGMYCTEWITWLTEPDSKRFEERFIKWAQKTKGRDVMLFDRSSIVVGTTTSIEERNSIYRLELAQIIIEYICVNDEMCILRKVFWKNEKEEILYTIPNSWNGVIPWYAY
ncbi:MAG: hypothetical protein IJE59_02580 [Clostridia bacterium]|nr:hypothetical protein [Clostridia bacterium]